MKPEGLIIQSPCKKSEIRATKRMNFVLKVPLLLAQSPVDTSNGPVRGEILALIRRLMDSWFGAVLGGGGYGAWAVWANVGQGLPTALGIGLAHWTTSALLTFFGTMAMRRFYGSASGKLGGVRAFVGGMCLTYASLFAVHWAVGTQNLLLTLAPGILPNLIFCSTYAALLVRTSGPKNS